QYRCIVITIVNSIIVIFNDFTGIGYGCSIVIIIIVIFNNIIVINMKPAVMSCK
ncbi:MAG: hypothetical protein ACI8RD_001591, partial [Bacillariaceae sp.]